MKCKLFILPLAIVLSSISIPSFAEKKIPRDDDLIKLEILRNFSMSPNGKYVLYTTSKRDLKNNQFLRQLWLLTVENNKSIQLTYDDKSVSNFGWLPKSEWLYFQRNNKLGFMRRNGGETRYIDIKEKGIHNIKFSSNERLMAFSAKPAQDKEIEKRKEHFGDFEVVQSDAIHKHIYTVKLTKNLFLDGNVEALTSGKDFSVISFDLSSDSEKIAFNAAKKPGLAAMKSRDLYSVDIKSKKVTVLDNSDKLQGRPIFSPDGSQVAYPTRTGLAYNKVTYVVSSNGGKPRALTTDFDESVSPQNWTKKGIFFLANTKTQSHVYLLNPESKKIKRVTKNKNAMLTNFEVSNSGETIVYAAATNDKLTELYLHKKNKTKQLTTLSKQLNNFIMADRKLITWKADDETEIEGVLTTPKNFDSTKKYPLFVITHGGPVSIDRPDLSRIHRLYPMDEWAGRGAVILQTNYRGSKGYGEKFRRLNWRNLGIGPVSDIISGVEHLINKGFIDESKIGCLGWSQGGYISALLSTYTDRCTVGHMGAGISNWKTYYYNTDWTLFTTEYFGKKPIEDDDIYRKTSPISYLSRAKTPVLIQHGEYDGRVPLANAHELRQGLTDVGVLAPMIIYKGIGHSPRNPKSLRAVRTHLNAWFSHYLFGDEKPDF